MRQATMNLEADVLYDADARAWIGTIHAPNGGVHKKCQQPGPLVTWMHDWATGRSVTITVTSWVGATPPDLRPAAASCTNGGVS